MSTYSIKPTKRQKQAVDNILSDKYKTKKEAMLTAGYSETSARTPGTTLFSSKGVRVYFDKLSKSAQKKWNVSLPEKVMETYLDGLEATKLVGRKAVEYPDWQARKQFADRFVSFFGWVEGASAHSRKKYNQFNFFSVPEDERNAFNEKFKMFLNEYYNNN